MQAVDIREILHDYVDSSDEKHTGCAISSKNRYKAAIPFNHLNFYKHITVLQVQ